MKTRNIEKYYDYLVALLLVFIPISIALPNIILILIVVSFLFLKNKKISKKVFKLIFIFAAYLAIKALIFNTFLNNFSSYKNIFFFLVILIFVYNTKDKRLLKKGFILGVLISSFFTLFKVISFYFEKAEIPLANGAGVHKMLLIDRPYLGIMCVLAVILCFDLYQKNKQWYYIVLMIYLSFFTNFIVARLAILLLFSFLFFVLILKIKKQSKKISYLSISAILLLLIFSISNTNLQKRFHIEKSFNKTMKVALDHEPRVVIWGCLTDSNYFNNYHLFFGYNDANRIKENLRNCFSEKIEKETKKTYYLRKMFNTHNQFFSFFYQGGLLALFLFLGILYFIFREATNFTNLFIIISLFVFLCFENLFERQYGLYLLGAFFAITSKNHDKSSSHS